MDVWSTSPGRRRDLVLLILLYYTIYYYGLALVFARKMSAIFLMAGCETAFEITSIEHTSRTSFLQTYFFALAMYLDSKFSLIHFS